MARPKLILTVLNQLETRLEGMKIVDPNLSLSNGLSVQIGETLKTDLSKQKQQYNNLITQLDALRIDIASNEKVAKSYCKNVLAGVKGQFGDDSSEYEKVGGKPLSKRKPVARKGKTLSAKKGETV
jgi:hypothetical protein